MSCLALDIDKFKAVNDGFGHAAGDRVIQQVGSTLVSSFRAADIVGRYGGDEFFVGMPGCDLEQGRAVGEKLRRAIEERCKASIGDIAGLHVTVSIGIATFIVMPIMSTTRLVTASWVMSESSGRGTRRRGSTRRRE